VVGKGEPEDVAADNRVQAAFLRGIPQSPQPPQSEPPESQGPPSEPPPDQPAGPGDLN
jgi:hypothetical protein